MWTSLVKIAVFTTLSILSVTILIGSLNMAGVCVSEAKLYSNEEKIDSAVRYVFAEYPDLINKLDYKSPEEYMSLLSNCCKVGLEFVGSFDYGVNRFVGKLSDYVLVAKISKKVIQNLSENEIISALNSLRDREWFVIAISNCGRSWDPFD